MRSSRFFVLLTALDLLACASGTARQQAEPAPSTAALEPDEGSGAEEAADRAAASEASEAPEAPEAERASADDSLVVLPDSEPAVTRPPTLVEAAAAARAQRAAAGPPVVTLTDENLQEFAAGGSLTYADAAEPPAVAETTAGTPPDKAAGATDAERGEEYWRSTLRAVRLRWRDAVQRIEDLNGRVAELRRAFYAEDDPVYRDREIKPAWDLALADLAAAKEEVRTAREELQRLLEAGRRAGALPGWLREGIELEPRPDETGSDLPEVELGEPEMVGESRP